MQVNSISGTRHQQARHIELRLGYINVGQTRDMWTAKNAHEHQARFANTVESVMVGSNLDILWLCEVGHHTHYLSGSQFTPKQVLENRPMLTAVADIIEDLGPYLILVRKNTGIEHLNMHHLEFAHVQGGRTDQKFVLSRFQIGQSTLVGVVAHVPRGTQERGHQQRRVMRVRHAVLHRIIECIREKDWYNKATVVIGGDLNLRAHLLNNAMQLYQPDDGNATPEEVWRVHTTEMGLKGDCFAYKAARVTDLEIPIGTSYQDADSRGCLDAHDVVAAKVTMTLARNRRTGDVAQLTLHTVHEQRTEVLHADTLPQKYSDEPSSSSESPYNQPSSSTENLPAVVTNSSDALSSTTEDHDAGENQGGNHNSIDDVNQLSAWEQHLLKKVNMFADMFWEMMEDDDLQVSSAFRERALHKLCKFIFARVQDDSGTLPRVRSRMEVMRSIKSLLQRRWYYDTSYAYEAYHTPRILTKVEMQSLMSYWKDEYESSEEQQEMIRRDKENDKPKNRKDKVASERRHGRFNLHIRRTYGNAAVCRCIIQNGRFDEVLLTAIFQTMNEKEPDEDDSLVREKKVRKMKATNAHRYGRYLANLIQRSSNEWYTFNGRQRCLYYAYWNGTLLKERNAAAKAFGSGSLFDREGEEIAQLTLEKSLSFKATEAICYMADSFVAAV